MTDDELIEQALKDRVQKAWHELRVAVESSGPLSRYLSVRKRLGLICAMREISAHQERMKGEG